MKTLGASASFSIVIIFFACGTSQAQAAPPPLSCNMQMLLTGLTAMQRDRGVSRKNAKIANTPDTDLTPQEIKQILDRVYIKGKNETPDQIKDDVYAKCQNGK